jgi:hypothetical protein
LRTIRIEVEEVEASDGVLHFDIKGAVSNVSKGEAMRVGMHLRSHIRGV